MDDRANFEELVACQFERRCAHDQSLYIEFDSNAAVFYRRRNDRSPICFSGVWWVADLREGLLSQNVYCALFGTHLGRVDTTFIDGRVRDISIQLTYIFGEYLRSRNRDSGDALSVSLVLEDLPDAQIRTNMVVHKGVSMHIYEAYKYHQDDAPQWAFVRIQDDSILFPLSMWGIDEFYEMIVCNTPLPGIITE